MMDTSLQIIKQKLTEIAPRIIEFSLNEGATEHDFEQLETLVGKKLPADFKELYKTYNGTNDEENWGNFFYGMTFSSLAEIVANYDFRRQQSESANTRALEKFDHQIESSNVFNSKWIQIGSDGSHCGLFVDLAPGEIGCYGQIIFIDNEYNVGILVANSTSELVDNFAADLKNNLYYLEPDALEDGHHFLETAQHIDLVNWNNVDKWKHLAGK